jgi:hypothetical protein
VDSTTPITPPLGDDTHKKFGPSVGARMFAPIWNGPENALKARLREEFGSSLCSRWASEDRRPDGDSRATIEKITAVTGMPILSRYWSERVES